MSIEELDQVSGGDMLSMAINVAEKYKNDLLGRLIEVSKPYASHSDEMESTGQNGKPQSRGRLSWVVAALKDET